MDPLQHARATQVRRYNLGMFAVRSEADGHIDSGDQRALLIAVLGDACTIMVRGMSASGVAVVVSPIVHRGMMGVGAVVEVRWTRAMACRMIVRRTGTLIEHPRTDCFVISSVSGSGIMVGRMIAIVSRMVVMRQSGVGVRGGTCIETRIWRRIAQGSISVSVTLSRTFSATRSHVLGVMTGSGVRGVITMLAVRGVLMIRNLARCDIGHTRSSAHRSTTHDCRDWTHVRG